MSQAAAAEAVRPRSQEELVAEPHTWLEARCSPYAVGTPFSPIVELIARAATSIDPPPAVPPADRPDAVDAWTLLRLLRDLRAEGHNTLVINPAIDPDQDPRAASNGRDARFGSVCMAPKTKSSRSTRSIRAAATRSRSACGASVKLSSGALSR